MTLRERLGITLLYQQEQPSSIEDELLRADVVSIRAAAASTNHQGSSRVNKVALASRRTCFHKPAAGVDEGQARMFGHEPFGVLINESAAWMVARALGPPFSDWIPTTMIRSIWPDDENLVGGLVRCPPASPARPTWTSRWRNRGTATPRRSGTR